MIDSTPHSVVAVSPPGRLFGTALLDQAGPAGPCHKFCRIGSSSGVAVVRFPVSVCFVAIAARALPAVLYRFCFRF